MQKKICIWLLLLAVNLFAGNLNQWWLTAKSSEFSKNLHIIKDVKFSTCELSKSCWHIEADSANLTKNKIYLLNPKLSVLGLKLPVLYDDLPLDSSGRSGLLWPKFGIDKLRGSFLEQSLYLWGSKFHIGQIDLQTSSKLGHVIKFSEQLALQFLKLDFWLASAAQGFSWRLKANNKNINIDWTDTNNHDLYWLWRLKQMPVLQARLERYLSLYLSSTIGDINFEVFSPKNLNSNYDHTLIADYHWLPRIDWRYSARKKIGTIFSQAQWTNFSLEKPLIGDLRPHSVHRLLLRNELSNYYKLDNFDVYTKFGLHTVKDNYLNNSVSAIVPWSFITLSRDFANITTKFIYRAAARVEQSLLPVLDSEELQQNISTWDNERYFAGHDRFSDISSIGLSLNYSANDWHALVGIRHNSSSIVCINALCNKNPENLLAFGFDYQNTFNGFLIYDKHGINYFNTSFSNKTDVGKLVFGYTKNRTTQHWYANIINDVSEDLETTISQEFQKTDLQLHNLTKITFTKHLKCLDLALLYSIDSVEHKKQNFMGFSLRTGV